MTRGSSGRLRDGAGRRHLVGWALIVLAAALLLWDLDHVPLWSLAAALAAFVGAATLLSRRAH